MKKQGTFGGVVLYTIIALVLGIITFAEFAIVQWPVFSRSVIFSGLYVLSIVKFLLVVMFFMHLKGDHKMLSGLFTTGMIIGGATVALLLFLFVAHNSGQESELQEVSAEIEAHGSDAHSSEDIEIPEASLAQNTSRPAPKSQSSVAISAANVTGLSLPDVDLPSFDNLSNSDASIGHAVLESDIKLLNAQIAELQEELQRIKDRGKNEQKVAEIEKQIENLEGELEQTEANLNKEPNGDGSDSSQEEVTVEEVIDFEWQALGKETYNTCLACHQANGEGIAGAFPPLKGNITDLYQAEGGRKYIINVVLYGLQGRIKVENNSYNGIMTPHKDLLSDEEVAAVLNHELTSWGNDALLEEFIPILPSEVALEREKAISARQVWQLRPDMP